MCCSAVVGRASHVLRSILVACGFVLVYVCLVMLCCLGVGAGHEATETGLAYAPVSQAHGHNHIVQCFACCTAA